jgi:hypothetical protein
MAEIIRPVGYEDALLFRRLTLLHVYGVVLIASIVLTAIFWSEIHGFFGGLTYSFWISAQVAIVLTLMMITTIPDWFCRPGNVPVEKQNRTVALGYYFSAALFAFPFTLVLATGVYLMRWWALGVVCNDAAEAIATIAATAGVLTVLKWWVDLILLHRRTLRLSAGRLLATIILMPALITLLGVLALVTIPAVVVYVSIIVASLF